MLTEEASIPIFMLGTNREIQSIIDRVSQRSMTTQEQKVAHFKTERAPAVGAESQMYCPSVADLPGPQPDQGKSSRLSAPKQRSPGGRRRVSPPRVAMLNPPSPDLPDDEKPNKAQTAVAKKKFRMPRPVPARPFAATEKKSGANLTAEATPRLQGRPFKRGDKQNAMLPKVPSQAAKPHPGKRSDHLKLDPNAKTLLQTKSQAIRDISRLTEVVET